MQLKMQDETLPWQLAKMKNKSEFHSWTFDLTELNWLLDFKWKSV